MDKIVGDAVHAIFNAPTDVPDHPRRAVECALAIVEATSAFALLPENAGLRSSRTRVGVETGFAIVGEVGGAGKVDYTAYGPAINTASRLEQLNKRLGSAICVGPECRARICSIAFRSLGQVDVRGRGFLALFEPLADGTAIRYAPTQGPPGPEPSANA